MEGKRTVPCAYCAGTGKIEIPAEVTTVEAYYFGCWEHAGHFWHQPNHCGREREIEARLPEAVLRRIDGGFCPGVVKGDLYRRSRPEVEGEAALHHVDGWTVLAWWDRSVDHRGACNSNLVALGTHDFTTMLEIGKAQFPKVISRQRTPIILVANP